MTGHSPPTPQPFSQCVGFIGTGIMGAGMAGHLLAAGCTPHVHSRTRANADPLVARGATEHDTPESVAVACPTVITMLGYPADVEATYPGGALAAVPDWWPPPAPARRSST